MSGWSRRSVLATGAATSIGSVLATSERGAAEPGDEDVAPAESGWSSYRGTPGNTASVPADGSFPVPETVAWEYDRGGRAAIVDGTVYLRTDGGVHALDATDGSARWEREDVGADGTPAVADDAVVVGGESLSVLEADTGEVRWSEPFDEGEHEQTVTSPTVVDGTAYVVAAGELLAYDVDDGTVVWGLESVEFEAADDVTEPGTEDAAFGSVPVAVANGLVYAIADGAGIAALDAEDGTTAWTHWRREYEGLSFAGVAATAQRVFVSGSPEDEFPILDAATGDRLGTAPSVLPTAATESVRIAASPDALRVTDYETDEGWEQIGGTSGWRDPAIVGETVLMPYYPGYNERALLGLELEDGAERWELTHPIVDGDALADWFAVTAETLYTNGENGLVALRAESDGGEADDDESDEDRDDERETGDDNESGENTDDGNESDDDVGNETDDEFDGEEVNETAGDDETTENETGGESDGEDPPADGDAEPANGTDESDTATDGTGDGDETDDEMPGFTAGAGIAGGVLGLEWLRRRAGVDAESQD
ncbi:outer membrane protein assembly factor BamB family protein [Natronococcus occultus]|uniref:Pyrrolo-quinoline quinone repeat domain-containing protein n=1 Tax=Natronococcus occultus SP4 TaxID=694430 RepID=L0K2W1_9EURY|nr:PQQ-binding-like beta-propeller repeat protein [Natronococcus occultus]AGB38699.1 hypothetical protein Natoc_2944 [Natronococcus occultus SP4]